MRYDNPVFNTVKSLAILLAIETWLMFTLVGVANYKSANALIHFVPLYIYIASVPLLGGIRLLNMLWELEKESDQSHKSTQFIFSTALFFPILSGMIPVLLMLRYATGR